jgi:hypothetical protein
MFVWRKIEAETVAHGDCRRVRKRTEGAEIGTGSDTEPLRRVRALCLALPETTERASHAEAAFFVADKKMFLMTDDHHHGADRLAFWCAAPPGRQQELVDAEPDRFFRPPYVGHRGWLGVRLDRDPDWDEITEIVEDAWRTVAPQRLLGRPGP